MLYRFSMPLDPYALCPGGRDKKIRFCCPNMLKEIEQVERLLESGQGGACLSYIESLEKNHPNCACLTTAKLSVYRSENRWTEALPIAERFHTDEPDNPTAAAEYALALVITGNPKLAVSVLVDAFERSKADTVQSTLLHAALQVGMYLLSGKLAISAIAIGNVLKEIPATAESANKLLYHATADVEIPLLIRDWAFDYNCPEDFPGKVTFEEVAVLVRLMRWKQALVLLEPLTQYADTWSGVWRNIAVLHFWLLDNAKGCEALKEYASLSNTPMEDVIDAETMRLLFVPNPLGDQANVLALEYIIEDAEKALEKLLSDPLFDHLGMPDRNISPPPKGVFVILDRPHTDSETLTLETVPSQEAFVVLFGKETDREARLLVYSLPDYNQENVETKMRNALGDLIRIPGQITVQTPTSKTQILTQCELRPSPKQDNFSIDMVEKVVRDYFDKFFVESWLALPLGLFEGKTPAEAAKESKYTVLLLATLQILAGWIPDGMQDSVIASLRSRLGLPAPDMITVADSTDEDPLAVLDAYPVWRWHRFDVSKLSIDTLAGGLQIVFGMQEMRVATRFAEELLSRPMDSMPFPVRVMAFEALITASQTKGNFENALLWVARAKNESASQGVADAAWCLHEVTIRLAQRNFSAVDDVLRYLVTNYKHDAAVMEALQKLFVRMGLFNSDGTPSAALLQAKRQPQPEEQQIWTPDGSASSGSGTPPKLWVPD